MYLNEKYGCWTHIPSFSHITDEFAHLPETHSEEH